MSPENDVLALVYAAMRLDRLQVLLDPGEMPPGTIIAFVDEKGTILARTVDPEKWVGQSIAHYPQFQTASRDREGTDRTDRPRWDSAPHRIHVRKANYLDGHGWHSE